MISHKWLMWFRVKKYRRRRRAIRGRGIPYVSSNKVYFGKGQRGGSVIRQLLAKALQGVGDYWNLMYKRFKLRKKEKRKLWRKQKGRDFWGDAAKIFWKVGNIFGNLKQWDEKEIMWWWN